MDEAVAGASTMPVLEAVVLGVVQGLTEFLPISSTAHLRAVPAFFGWADPGVAYSAVIQLGSVAAVLCFFWKDFFQLTIGSVRALRNLKKFDAKDVSEAELRDQRDLRLFGSILIGTLPICVLGLLLKPVLEQEGGPLRSLQLIGGASIFMGILLFIAEKVAKRQRTINDITGKDGLLVGLGQAMALIPGCSRSGSTLTIALFRNLNRADAARYSFLLGTPAIVLSGLLELKEMFKHGVTDAGMTSLAAGLVCSTVVSYAAIWWMLKFLQNNTTTVFIIYRLIFGIAVIALSTAGIIK